MQKHIKQFQADKEKQAKIEEQRKAVAEKAKAEKAAADLAKKEAEDAQTMEVTEEEAALIQAQEEARKANPAAATALEKDAEEKPEGTEEEEKKDDEDANKQAPNAGNGGKTDKYDWEQTLQEVTVNIPIPDGTTSKQLTVVIGNENLKVGIKGQPLMIDGALHKRVKKSDCIWTLETNDAGQRILQVSLTKKDVQNWWSCVI